MAFMLLGVAINAQGDQRHGQHSGDHQVNHAVPVNPAHVVNL
jgi:hypothetical protein